MYIICCNRCPVNEAKYATVHSPACQVVDEKTIKQESVTTCEIDRLIYKQHSCELEILDRQVALYANFWNAKSE